MSDRRTEERIEAAVSSSTVLRFALVHSCTAVKIATYEWLINCNNTLEMLIEMKISIDNVNADASYLCSAKGVPREDIFDAGSGECVEGLVLDDVARMPVHEEATTRDKVLKPVE